MFPGGGLKIAKIFGIEIDINATWLVIFALVGFSLGETLPLVKVEGHPGTFPHGPLQWVFGFGMAALFFAGLLAHELSHSYVAKRHGVKIKRITLFIFGGVAEMSEDVTDPNTELKMAVAGPLMTFFLAGVYYLIFRILAADPSMGQTWLVPLYLLFYLNMFVGVFNLLPGFPLDGGRVFRALVWKKTGDLEKSTRWASYGGQTVAGLMVAAGLFFIAVGDSLGGIWIIFIGAFIFYLSRASYRQTLFRLAVADTKVSDIMFTDVPVVGDKTTLTELRNNYFGIYHLPGFPVADSGGKVVGFVKSEDLFAVNQAEWDLLDAGRIAHPLAEDQVIDPDTRLDQILRRVLAADQFLLAMRDGRVAGILTGDELMRYIRARAKATGRKVG